MNAEWHPDPTGRHELRYWDGAQWTEHVSDGGVQSVSPLDGGGAPQAAAQPAQAQPQSFQPQPQHQHQPQHFVDSIRKKKKAAAEVGAPRVVVVAAVYYCYLVVAVG